MALFFKKIVCLIIIALIDNIAFSTFVSLEQSEQHAARFFYRCISFSKCAYKVLLKAVYEKKLFKQKYLLTDDICDYDDWQ